MSLIAWVGVKGAHGASTGAVAVASVWPAEHKILLAELDPAGGDVAARFGLAPDPGLVQLGAAFRHGLSAEEIWNHTQTLPGGVPVLVGPASAQQGYALGGLWAQLGPVLASMPEVDVVADCGRLEPGSPALAIASDADLVVLVTRPTLQGVAHLRARLPVPLTKGRVGIVLVGERPYRPADVEAAVGVKVIGVLAHDERAAAMLNGEPGSSSSLNRSALIRSARSITTALANIAHTRARPQANADAPGPHQPAAEPGSR